VRNIGQELNLTKEVVESVALIASEVTHNQLAHARHGYFAVKGIERDGVKGLEVIAADIGPAIKKPGLAIQDKGYSTSGSLGAGVAAVCRIADEVAFDNRIDEGFCIIARKFEKPEKLGPSRSPDVAIMGRPYPGEIISGDDAVFFDSASTFMAAVADGMGHGPDARNASNRAMEGLSTKLERNLEEIVIALNHELSGTHGCAMSIIRYHKNTGEAECACLGDVHSHVYHLKEAHFFTPTPLVLAAGQFQKQRVRVEKVAVQPGSVLIMFTDGLKSRTTLKGQLDVLRQPPIAIAEHLLENDSRPDDDALVLVARFPR
jgi:anti-sigma regulatory factor (Ser/Thr protein kinase)